MTNWSKGCIVAMWWVDSFGAGVPRRMFVLSQGVLMFALAGVGSVAAQPDAPATEYFSTAPTSGSASDGPVVNMQAAVDKAVSWHPSVRSARSQVLQADEGIDAARAGYYPRISGGINNRSSNSTITNYDSRHIQRAEISASQMLYDFGKVGSQVERASSATDVARARVLMSIDEVVRSTAYAWIEVRRQEALEGAAQELVETVEDIATLASEREAEGASTLSDTVQARARVDSARIELLSAESQAQRWRTTLMHWMGERRLPMAAGEPPAGIEGACTAAATPAVTADRSVSRRGVSAIQVAEAQVQVARAEAEIARTQLLPTLSLDVSAGRGLNSRSRAIGERSVDTTVMLNFSMPLYEGGRLQADRRAAEHAVSAARAALDEAHLNVEQGGEDASLEWRKFASRKPVQAAREESMRLTRSLYRDQYLQLGTRSLLDLLNAEQEYYGARRDQIDTTHEMMRLGVDCLFHAGRLRQVFTVHADLDDPVSAGWAQ